MVMMLMINILTNIVVIVMMKIEWLYTGYRARLQSKFRCPMNKPGTLRQQSLLIMKGLIVRQFVMHLLNSLMQICHCRVFKMDTILSVDVIVYLSPQHLQHAQF